MALPLASACCWIKIAERAAQYAARYGPNVEVAEIIEFSSNFYVLVREKDSWRGAFEIVMDSDSGAVEAEVGPGLLWNTKYGRRGGRVRQRACDNILTLAQARDVAARRLAAQVAGGQVNAEGRTFYGYYTFDYEINGRFGGLLSVNGLNGQIYFHAWHRQFVARKKLSQ